MAELFAVNPRVITGAPKISPLLEAKTPPVLIIKPMLILVMYVDDLGWNIISNQQEQILFQNLNIIVGRPNVVPGQIVYCTTNGIKINLMFQENFRTITHKAVEVTGDSEE